MRPGPVSVLSNPSYTLKIYGSTMATLRITQTKSIIGAPPRQRRSMEALGIRRMHQTVQHDDSPQIRGMIDRVRHLVNVEEAK